MEQNDQLGFVVVDFEVVPTQRPLEMTGRLAALWLEGKLLAGGVSCHIGVVNRDTGCMFLAFCDPLPRVLNLILDAFNEAKLADLMALAYYDPREQIMRDHFHGAANRIPIAQRIATVAEAILEASRG